MHPAPLCSHWGKFGYVWGAAHDAPIEQQVSRLRLDGATIEQVVRAVGDEQETEVPAALDVSRVARRRRQLALEHAGGALTDDEYLSATHALADQATDPVKHERVTPEEAVAYLRDLGQLWAEATVQERSDLLHAIYARITGSQPHLSMRSITIGSSFASWGTRTP